MAPREIPASRGAISARGVVEDAISVLELSLT
jgi:hypothetical protein